MGGGDRCARSVSLGEMGAGVVSGSPMHPQSRSGARGGTRLMRFVLFVAFFVGTAFFAVLPIYAPPIVLQAEEVPRFLVGLVATISVGAALGLVAGRSRGMPLVLACTFAGSFLNGIFYTIPNYAAGEPWRSGVLLVLVFFAYMLILATVGLILAFAVVWLVRSLVPWLPGSRSRP